MESNNLKTLFKEVMLYYNTAGCQCRFPRFRQLVSIDCSDTGNSFYITETEGLISEARSFFNITEIEPFPEVTKQLWTCKTCQSVYEFGWCDFSISISRSYLKIKELQVIDVGEIPKYPIPLYHGPIGHSVPTGKFISVSFHEMASYLKA